jgi:hypothetical protein
MARMRLLHPPTQWGPWTASTLQKLFKKAHSRHPENLLRFFEANISLKIIFLWPFRPFYGLIFIPELELEVNMKRYCSRTIRVFFFFILSAVCLYSQTGPVFDNYFVNENLRVDYYHMADKTSEWITLDRTYRQGTWAGNPGSLIDSFDNGQYYIKVYDATSGELIYSRGFNSYCAEYITTDMAARGIKRTYHETVLVPFPKAKIKFTLERRARDNRLSPIFEQVIDPQSIDINNEAPEQGVTVFEFLKNGDPHKKVDLAVLSEGYTEGEKEKFEQDLKKAFEVFFSFEPYKSYKKDFNVYGVFKPSRDSGTDEPTHSVFKNTVFGTSFNSMGLYRYMLTEENRPIRDAAAHVPYDLVLVMVNTPRYGGGGIYNFYCVFSVNEEWYGYLLLHEFGHAFAGLGDEYYASNVVYNEFYPAGVEPTDPNLTALLDPENLKWKHLLTKGVEIPTPWEKDKFDKMNAEEKKTHLARPEYRGIVGAFEGAGYASKGLYRPMIDCIMFSKRLQPYCVVCREAVLCVIRQYTR